MTPEVKERIEQIRHGNVPEGYKRTTAGIVPNDWSECTLGDIYTERKEPGREDLPLLMVSIHSGVSDGEVDEDDLPKKVKRIEDKTQYKRAATGDLVFNMMRAWQGAIGTVRTEGMVSPAYIVAEPNGLVEPLFMDYYMKMARMVNACHRQSYGVTDFRLRLYWDSFAPIRCALPPVAEQCRIGELLAVQNKVIELKEKLLEEKQLQKKYLMQQLLSGKKRLPGFSGEWGNISFQKAFTFLPTNTLSRDCMSEIEGEIFNIHYGDILTKYPEVLTMTSEKIPRMKPTAEPKNIAYAMEGDLVIADTAEDLSAGKAVEIRNVGDKRIAAGLHTMLCRPYEGLFAAGWLGYYLNSSEFHNQLIPLICGVKVSSISKKEIVRTNIAVPSLEEQRAIVAILTEANTEIELLRQDIEQEKQKKKALMQLLLTGIVRVNV